MDADDATTYLTLLLNQTVTLQACYLTYLKIHFTHLSKASPHSLPLHCMYRQAAELTSLLYYYTHIYYRE